LCSYNCYQSCLLPFFVHTLPHCAHDHSHHIFLCFYYWSWFSPFLVILVMFITFFILIVVVAFSCALIIIFDRDCHFLLHC
jgi:hypothetical protein